MYRQNIATESCLYYHNTSLNFVAFFSKIKSIAKLAVFSGSGRLIMAGSGIRRGHRRQRRRQHEVVQPLHLAPPVRHGIEHQTAGEAEEGENHEEIGRAHV